MSNFIYSMLFSFALATPGTAYAEDTHKGHQHAASDSAGNGLKLNQGMKWETDASLRKGMAEINALLRDNLKKIHSGKLSLNAYARLGEKINGSLQGIFKNCKLAPEADVVLHTLLAKIIEGADDMKSEAKIDQRRAGAEMVGNALSEYPKFFQHPGWAPADTK